MFPSCSHLRRRAASASSGKLIDLCEGEVSAGRTVETGVKRVVSLTRHRGGLAESGLQAGSILPPNVSALSPSRRRPVPGGSVAGHASVQLGSEPVDLPGQLGVPRTLTGKKLEVPVKRLLQGVEAGKAVDPATVDRPAVLDWYVEFALRTRKRWAR